MLLRSNMFLCDHFDNVLLKVQCGLRKGFSTQESFIAMLSKWRRNLDKSGSCGDLLNNLSKAFARIVHDFLITKLEARSFTYKALNVTKNSLSDWTHRTKAIDSYCLFLNLLIGVPKGSILVPLLFNVYVCDLFQEIVTSYADDTTPLTKGTNELTVLNDIENKALTLFG